MTTQLCFPLLVIIGVAAGFSMLVIRTMEITTQKRMITPLLTIGGIIAVLAFINYLPSEGSWDMGSADPIILFCPILLGGWLLTVGVLLWMKYPPEEKEE
jgi:hypothetical protein